VAQVAAFVLLSQVVPVVGVRVVLVGGEVGVGAHHSAFSGRALSFFDPPIDVVYIQIS